MPSNLNMGCGPPMATIPSLMCSMPSVMNQSINGCNQWSAIWTTPPNTYQYNYALNQSMSANIRSQQMSQSMPFMASNAFQAWNPLNAIQPLISPQFGPFLRQNCAENSVFNHMNGGQNQTNVPQIQRFPNDCDNSNNSQITHPNNKSFDVLSSHSSRNKFTSNSSQSHKNNSFKSNQRIDRNINNNNNSFKRDTNHKNNNQFNNNNNNNTNKLKSKSNQRFDSRGHCCSENNIKVKVTKSPDNDSEPESKRRKYSSHRNSDEIKPNSEDNDRNKEPKDTTKSKKDQSLAADTQHILNKPVEWMRCSPADLFYEPQKDNSECVTATKRLVDLRDKFCFDLLDRSKRAVDSKPKFHFPPRVVKLKAPKTSIFLLFIIYYIFSNHFFID